MDKEEFKNICKIRGIACQEICKNYIKKYNKEDYTDEDLIQLYRIEQNTYCNTNKNLKSYYDLETYNYSQIKDDKGNYY